MKCKFEHDGDCCNCGSPQYMCKCKPNICGSVVPMTNADRIRAMSDEELANFIPDWSYTKACKCDEQEFIGCDNQCEKCVFEWLKQPAEEDT